MEKKLHLIAGLPRSGSTLLASILNQNPKFHTTITDVLCLAVKDAMYSLTSQMYHSVITDDTRKSKVIKGMIDNFYYDVSNFELLLIVCLEQLIFAKQQMFQEFL